MKEFPEEKHMKIRRIRENDTENFFQMMCRLDEETEYMMYEPGERQRTTKNLSRLKAFVHALAVTTFCSLQKMTMGKLQDISGQNVEN